MGRGRAKAKQTRVARELKYFSPDTDLGALQQELANGNSGPNLRTNHREDNRADGFDADGFDADGFDADGFDAADDSSDEDDWADIAEKYRER